MSVSVAESALRTFRRLWKKAPLWRFTGLSAALLTLLFLLFAPRGQAPVPSDAVAQPSYVPQPKASLPAPSPSLTATPTPKASAQPPAEVKVQPPTPKSVSQNVQTANLSLATPDSTHTQSGLDNAMAGRSFNGSLRVDGFNVPLPAGNWLLLANIAFKTPTSKGEFLYLGQVKNSRLTGAIRITAARSTQEPGAGFRAPPGCIDNAAGNSYVSVEEVVPFGHESCWIVAHMFMSPLEAWADRSKKLEPIERAAAGDLAAKGVSYPQDMMAVRFTRAETWGLLEVRYIFNPENDHITSTTVASYADSDWQPGSIANFPEKLAYVDKLKHWATAFLPHFKAAFDEGKGPPVAN